MLRRGEREVAGSGSASRPGDIASALELLHERQARRGFVAEEDLVAVAPVAGLSATELFGVVTAYPQLRLAPGDPSAVCSGPACMMKGAREVSGALGATGHTACLGLCDQPVAVLTKDGPRVASRANPLRLEMPAITPVVVGVQESAFFGDDDPFATVDEALAGSPADLIDAVCDSGLRGRGGAGFPTGRKWAAVRAAAGETKYVVCNADESEPGTFKDRQILDHQPRRLLAGMRLAGHAIGARRGIVYIRYEYGPQVERLRCEIEGLRQEGRLGREFDVVLRRGAGAYVCGEETAMLNSLEGRGPTPRERPPYPTTHGLFGAPTLVQNVETLAAVPAIIARGPAWYRDATAPKLYCVSGDVASPGVFELPMTVTVRELLTRAGARIDDIKAFTLGGLSGGFLSSHHLDLRLDFEAPRKIGAHLGSGAIIVLDARRCIVRFLLEAMRFFADESCGKCFPCRIGVVRLRERLEAVVGQEPIDTGKMREVIGVLRAGSACGLGAAAGLMAENLLDRFGQEVEAHRQGNCPTGECGEA
jgi:NADH-quinone oxidoreductase subunit F